MSVTFMATRLISGQVATKPFGMPCIKRRETQ
jgi:hypothetical protein